MIQFTELHFRVRFYVWFKSRSSIVPFGPSKIECKNSIEFLGLFSGRRKVLYKELIIHVKSIILVFGPTKIEFKNSIDLLGPFSDHRKVLL